MTNPLPREKQNQRAADKNELGSPLETTQRICNNKDISKSSKAYLKIFVNQKEKSDTHLK